MKTVKFFRRLFFKQSSKPGGESLKRLLVKVVIVILDFPNGCVEIRGSSNDRNCFINIWNDSGCVEDGQKYPGNLNVSILAELQQLSLM